jgi:hypothetical protein
LRTGSGRGPALTACGDEGRQAIITADMRIMSKTPGGAGTLPGRSLTTAKSLEEPNMSDSEVTYNWNGEVVRFNDWRDEAFGEYEYLTRDQRHFFRFDLQLVSGYIRIYIREQPSYCGRPTEPHDTHRYCENEVYYVCVDDNLQPDNVPDALSWAVYWAEETGQYIDTGRAFS